MSPPVTRWVTEIATSPQSWFVLIVLAFVLVAITGKRKSIYDDSELRKKIESLRGEIVQLRGLGETLSTLPQVEEWVGSSDAFYKFADSDIQRKHSDVVKEFEKLNKQIAIVSEEQERERLQRLIHEAQTEANLQWWFGWENIHQKLARGELVARGFRKPFSDNPISVMIPLDYWQFLKFIDQCNGASGEGIAYAAIMIGRPI